jgi:hypothetical protein
MAYKNLLIILFSFLASFSLQAQIGKIEFKKTTHDFGTISEESTKAVYEFEFTNTGKGDLKILNVQASCGCTSPEYTKNPVKPGQKGFIKVTYSTVNRPGAFRKSITVTVNNPEKPNVVLFIKGNVTPKGKSKAELYPVAIGNLELMTNHLAFNELNSDETRTDSVKIYNAGSQAMDLSFEQVPAHLQVKANPTQLPIDGEGYLIVTYNGSKKKDFGLVYDRFGIRTNDVNQPLKSLNVSARITLDFSHLSKKDMEQAPKISFKAVNYDFGTVKSGSVITYQFEFTNEGKQVLEVLKIKSSCGCTTSKLLQTSYKKGKSGMIEAIFDTSGRKGAQHKTLTVITNDPNNAEIVLNITGKIE